MYTLALLWMMEMETHHQANSSLMLGLVLMAALVPQIVLAPIAGVLVDRWPKRATMLITDFIRGALLAVLTLLAITHHTLPWELIGFNLVLSAVGTCFNPASVVMVKGLAGESHLLEARSILNVGQQTMQIAGPAVAGLLIAGFGTPFVFAINAITFFLSAISLLILRAQEPSTRRGSLRPKALYGDVREGAAVYMKAPYARALLPFMLIYQFPIAATEFLIVSFVANALHDASNHGAFIVGVFNTADGLGSLAGSFAVAYLAKRLTKERLPVITMSVAALCVLAIGLSRSPFLIAALFFIGGFFMMIGNIIFFTTVQIEVPTEALGRIYAMITALFNGTTPLSQLVFGFAAPFVPIGDLFSAAGAFAFLGASAAWLHPIVRHPPKTPPPTEPPGPDDSLGHTGHTGHAGRADGSESAQVPIQDTPEPGPAL